MPFFAITHCKRIFVIRKKIIEPSHLIINIIRKECNTTYEKVASPPKEKTVTRDLDV